MVPDRGTEPGSDSDDRRQLSVASQRADHGSTLHLYRTLLHARRATDALRLGDHTELPTHPRLIAYRRRHGDQERVVVVNFDNRPRPVELAGRWRVEVDTAGCGGPDDRAGQVFGGRVAAEQGLLLRPDDERAEGAASR